MENNSSKINWDVHMIWYWLLYFHMCFEEIELIQLWVSKNTDHVYYLSKIQYFLKNIKEIWIDNVINKLDEIDLETLSETDFVNFGYRSSIKKEYPEWKSF